MTAQEILKQAKSHLEQSIAWLEMAKKRQTEVMKDLVSEEDKEKFDQTLQETQHELYKCSVLNIQFDRIQL